MTPPAARVPSRPAQSGTLPRAPSRETPAVPLDSAAVAALYESLPARRRAEALDSLLRAAAAVRIKALYPFYAQRYVREAAYRETAAAVNGDMRLPVVEGGFEVTPRWVQAVMREGR